LAKAFLVLNCLNLQNTMGKKELVQKVNSLNTKMPKSSVAMIKRMNATKARVESAVLRPATKKSDSITVQFGI
jgi:hypothetical protein